MIKFEKVSFDVFKDSCLSLEMNFDEEMLKTVWENIKIPERATSGSAGYDFYMPFSTIAYPICVMSDMSSGESEIVRNYITIPTGIRWICDEEDDCFLMCVPRSGLGFKKGFRLANTVGIIDKDYWKSDNEGHIMVKFSVEETNSFMVGKAFLQGIIVPFAKTTDDKSSKNRNGGFGSTDSTNS